jgi:hypothetical protein
MARRKHRRNPRAKYKVRHVVLKKNGARRRRLRRNGPEAAGSIAADAALAEMAGADTSGMKSVDGGRSSAPARFDFSKPRGWKADYSKAIKREEGKQRKRASSALERAAKAARGRAKRAKGLGKRTQTAQAARLAALAAVVRHSGRNKALKSPLIKAMTIRSNPSMEDVKILGMQAVAGAAGFAGMAAIGKFVTDLFLMEKGTDGVSKLKASYIEKVIPQEGAGALLAGEKRGAVAKYAPAVGTLAATLVGLYLLSGKTKYAVGITIGGMSAAILQAVLAKDELPVELAKDASTAAKVKSYLGFGEYTTVGSGIFHGVGEYTTVGQAHPFRPRNFGDDQMEWASTGGLGAMLTDRGGADNSTEFAPGEGGIFSKTPLLSR